MLSLNIIYYAYQHSFDDVWPVGTDIFFCSKPIHGLGIGIATKIEHKRNLYTRWLHFIY